MPDMVTLREIVDTFTEQELDMTVPFDFKNPTNENIEYVDHYNKLIADGKYEDAMVYRKEHTELESLIYDANTLNRQQALMINTYLFAKGERSAANIFYDNAESGAKSDTIQGVVDEICDTLGMNGNTTEGGLCDRVENLENALSESGFSSEKIKFDGAAVGSSATTIQDALVEIYNILNNIPKFTWNASTSTLTIEDPSV